MVCMRSAQHTYCTRPVLRLCLLHLSLVWVPPAAQQHARINDRCG
jgi:hypothetical protein